jgi:hypothetical protein
MWNHLLFASIYASINGSRFIGFSSSYKTEKESYMKTMKSAIACSIAFLGMYVVSHD